MVTVADIKERLKLNGFTDEDLAPHLRRAEYDFRDKIFESDDNDFERVEAVACKAIYYLAPMLWQRVAQRANEYEETLSTFQDVEKFQAYWLERCESIPFVVEVDETPSAGTFGEIGMGSV